MSFKIKYTKLIVLIILYGILGWDSLFAQTDTVKPMILHNAVAKTFEGQPLIIEAIVTDNDKLQDVTLFYRTVGESNFKYELMNLEFNDYRFEIPSEDIGAEGIEYYIEAVDSSDNRAYAPEIDPEDYPYLIAYESFSGTSTPADTVKPTILHNAVAKTFEGQPLIIEAIVTDNDKLKDVTLFYRAVGDTIFHNELMTLEVNDYRFEIPSEDIGAKGIEYYIEAVDSSDNRAYVPEIDPENNPYLISFGMSAPDVLLLNPEDGSVNSDGHQLIIVSLYDEEDDIDVASIKMEVDGVDVTDGLEMNQDIISYVPSTDFALGSHSIKFYISDLKGNESPPMSWTFLIKEVKVKVRKPLFADAKIKGVIDYESEFDTFSGKDQPENRPFDTQKPRVKLTFSKKNLKATVGIALNKHFDPAANDVDKNRQPLDRFRFSIATPVISFKAGDHNPSFSKLTLKGARVRGTVTDFHYKGLSTQFVYGRTKEMIPGFTSFSNDSTVYNKGTLSRKLIGLSTQYNYQDIVEFGVNYLQVKDDTTSLEDEVYGNFSAIPDSLRNNYAAQSNKVVGVNSRVKLFDGKTEVVSYWAASILTEDIVDPVRRNQDVSTYNSDKGLLTNISEGTYLVEFTNRNQYFDLKGSFKRIPRLFSSLGNSSIQTDIQGLKLDGRTKLSNNQIMLTLGYENTHNNLDLLDVQTVRNATYSGNMNMMKPGFPGLNLGYRFMTHKGKAVVEDTLNLSDDKSSTITIAPTYSLSIKNVEIGLSGNLMFMNFQDDANRESSFKSNSYMLAITQNYPNRLSVNLGFGLSQNIPLSDNKTTFTLLNGKVAYALKIKNKKVKFYSGTTLVYGSKAGDGSENEIDNRKVSFNVGGQYKFSKNQFIGLDIGLVKVNDFVADPVGSKDYTEIKGKLKYKYTF